MFGGSRGGYSGYLAFASEASGVWPADDGDDDVEGEDRSNMALALASALALALALASVVDDARRITRRERKLVVRVVVADVDERSIPSIFDSELGRLRDKKGKEGKTR